MRKARQLLEGALEGLKPFRDPQGMNFIQNELGHVLLAIGDSSGASLLFNEARQAVLDKGLLPLVCESVAGLAASALAQGQYEDARTHVTEAWDYLKVHGGAAMENPSAAYGICAEVFEALGEQENARLALEAGHQALVEKADTINIPEWRQSFLENVPENRALLEMWERRKV
jgi:eukaryotic-like serine/threonine-protein kinase